MIDQEDEARQSLRGIAAMGINWATFSMWVVTTDGRTVSEPLEPPPINVSGTIIRTMFVPHINRLFLETNRGDTIEIELPTLHSSAPHDGRPMVYLDQRDWSLLANILFEPERVASEREREAAEQLISWARARQIILPMSFAHLAETAKWGDTDRRYRLALTVTQLSRGWQMRYPLDVWRHELGMAMIARSKHLTLPPLDVFTLEAAAVQSSQDFPQEDALAPAQLPTGVASVKRAIVCMMSYIDLVLASEATAMAPIPGWVTTFQRITEIVANAPHTSSQKRKALRGVLMGDIEMQITEAFQQSGITLAELKTWGTSHFDADMRMMNALGLWSEVFQDKHLDASTKWSANDLIDMMYLTCAAGYADYVVAERSLTNYLNQAARRLRRPIKIYSRISELVDTLQTDGFDRNTSA